MPIEMSAESQKRHAGMLEVNRAAEPKLKVLKNLKEDYPFLQKEIDQLLDIMIDHEYERVPKETFLEKIQYLTGADYTALYDAAYNAERPRNLKGQFMALSSGLSID